MMLLILPPPPAAQTACRPLHSDQLPRKTRTTRLRRLVPSIPTTTSSRPIFHHRTTGTEMEDYRTTESRFAPFLHSIIYHPTNQKTRIQRLPIFTTTSATAKRFCCKRRQNGVSGRIPVAGRAFKHYSQLQCWLSLCGVVFLFFFVERDNEEEEEHQQGNEVSPRVV